MAAVVVARSSGSPSEEDGLKAKLRSKQQRADELRAKIMKKRLQAQSLKIQLKAIGVTDTGFVPGRVTAGAGTAAAGAPGNHSELRSLLEWLAESADLTRQVNFECGASGAGVVVGGRRVLLQRMAAIPLGAGITGSKLQLSVPLELQAEIVALLLAVRQRGGKAGEVEVAKVSESWDMVGAEMVSASTRQQEPAIFLVHRESQEGAAPESDRSVRAIVVAQWPCIDFAKLAAASMFNADAHFQRLASMPAPAIAQLPLAQVTTLRQVVQLPAKQVLLRQLTLQRVPPRTPQREQAQSQSEEEDEASSSSTPSRRSSEESSTPSARPSKVNKGDRVVILYNGRWFRGVLQFVDSKSNMANVKCDCDSPGVITVVPLENIWPIAMPPTSPDEPAARPVHSPQRHFFRHARAKTVG